MGAQRLGGLGDLCHPPILATGGNPPVDPNRKIIGQDDGRQVGAGKHRAHIGNPNGISAARISRQPESCCTRVGKACFGQWRGDA